MTTKNTAKNQYRFWRYVGASTTASRLGKRLGHNVSVAAYLDQSDPSQILLRLESNLAPVHGVPGKYLNRDEYDALFGNLDNGQMMQKALELFDCRTAWSN